MDSEETEEIEKYEYLLVEYVKEISNEITYLLLIVTSLFLYMLINLFRGSLAAGSHIGMFGLTSVDLVRIIFVLAMIGGFALFTISNLTKRRIEGKFDKVFEKD